MKIIGNRTRPYTLNKPNPSDFWWDYPLSRNSGSKYSRKFKIHLSELTPTPTHIYGIQNRPEKFTRNGSDSIY